MAQKKDSIKINQGRNRNVMLNADNSVGPREVNIGLPSSVGGTTILQNGIPVVYWYWPEMPTTCWRQDATLTKTGLLGPAEAALETGVVGYDVDSYDNTGTDKFHVRGNFNSNHFGLLRGTTSISGPLGHGFKYVAGAYLSFDPGTFNPKGITRYYADNTKMFKFGLTKDYNNLLGKGSVTVFYRYANSRQMQNSYYAPYVYNAGGKVEEYNGFKVGEDSYLVNTSTMTMKDPISGKYFQTDAIDGYRARSHSFDLMWKNWFHNGYYLDFVTRFRMANVGIHSPAMSGVNATKGNYTYLDGSAYNGEYVQNVLLLNTKRTPIRTWITSAKLSKQFNHHYVTAGLSDWLYAQHRYLTESAYFYQSVESDPQIVVPKSTATTFLNGFYGFNSVLEYHDGTMNRTAFLLKDKWDVSNHLTLKMGTRLEYQALRGHYIATAQRSDRTYGKSPIRNDFFNKDISVNGVYKITKQFGVLADLVHTELGGILGNYNTGTDPDMKQSKTNMADFGVYLNDKYVSVVSQITYIKKTNYRANSSFVNPKTGESARTVIKYDVQTLGWTTDVIFKPCKYFNLHYLLTLQNPQYKNYGGTLTYSTGTRDYDFNGSCVTGISKVLMEIDPTFMYKDFMLTLNARYFGKQYANLSNTLTFASHWETFGRASYKFTNFLSGYIGVVNILNQRGAKSTISGTNLMTAEEAKERYGTVLSGTYIRPFTIEFGVNFNF
jgi:hypothetical protein